MGTTEDEMVVLAEKYGHEFGNKFEQTPRDGEGQESLVCYSSWGSKESDIVTLTLSKCLSQTG